VTTLSDYVDGAGDLPLLGTICINTTYDGSYEVELVQEVFQAEGLDTSFIPSPSGAKDAFSKAITNHKETSYVLSNGHKVSIMLREMDSSNPTEYAVRALVREERSTNGESLFYDNIGEIKHYHGVRRGAGRQVDDTAARLYWGLAANSDTLALSDEERAKIRNVAIRVHNDYQRYRSSLDGKKVRAMVTSYLRHLDAIKLKDSVYFVPVAHSESVRALRVAVSHFGECTLDGIPLVDFQDQRDLIIRTFQADTDDAMSTLAGQLQQARANPSAATYERLRKQYDELTTRTRTYTSTLGDSVAKTTGSHEIVKAALVALQTELLGG